MKIHGQILNVRCSFTETFLHCSALQPTARLHGEDENAGADDVTAAKRMQCVHVAGWWKTKVTHLIAKITGCCRCQGCFGSRLLLQCAAEGAWGQQPWPCPCNQLPYVAWRSRNTRHESRNSPVFPAITPQQPFPGHSHLSIDFGDASMPLFHASVTDKDGCICRQLEVLKMQHYTTTQLHPCSSKADSPLGARTHPFRSAE